MRRSELVRALEAIPPSRRRTRRSSRSRPRPSGPPTSSWRRSPAATSQDGRSRTSGAAQAGSPVGAALLGAQRVDAFEVDHRAVAAARGRGAAWVAGTSPTWRTSPTDAETVVMNPPFGAQQRGADRPFWDVAFARPRAVYAFALADSRTFIEAIAVERGARVEAHRPVPWTLGPTFRHHRKRSVALPVDLWVIRTEGPTE